jgi:hypothetical protein
MSQSVLSLRKAGPHKETHNTVSPGSKCPHDNHVQSSRLDKAQQVSVEKKAARPVENEESYDSWSNF